jgi:hypothetical protein
MPTTTNKKNQISEETAMSFIPKHQLQVVSTMGTGGGAILENLVPELQAIPTRPQKVDRNGQQTVYAHFFFAGCDWFILDYNKKYDEFCGFAIINHDYQMAELGYIPADYFRNEGRVELDFHWQTKTLDEAKAALAPDYWS